MGVENFLSVFFFLSYSFSKEKLNYKQICRELYGFLNFTVRTVTNLFRKSKLLRFLGLLGLYRVVIRVQRYGMQEFWMLEHGPAGYRGTGNPGTGCSSSAVKLLAVIPRGRTCPRQFQTYFNIHITPFSLPSQPPYPQPRCRTAV